MKPKFLRRSAKLGLIPMAALLATSAAQAGTTYYWDSNDGTGGFGTAGGTWSPTTAGTAARGWSTDPTGATVVNGNSVTTSSADDVNFGTATLDYKGTVTVLASNTVNASSITIGAASSGTVTLQTGTINIGGTGTYSGIFSNSANAVTITAPIILNSTTTAFNFSNSGAGLLSIKAVTGSASSGTQTITVNSSSSGDITQTGVWADGLLGGKVAVDVNSSGAGVLTLNQGNLFTGGLTISKGTVSASSNGFALGKGSLNLNGGTLITGGKSFANGLTGTTVGGDFTIIADFFGTSPATTSTIGPALSIGAYTLTVRGASTFTSGTAILQVTGATTLTGSATFDVDNSLTSGGAATLLTLSGAVGESGGSRGITKLGTGTLALNGGFGTYTGDTLISNGQIKLGDNTAMAQSAYDTTGSTGAIGLDVTGRATPTLGGLAGSVNLATAITGYSGVTGLTLNPQTGKTVSYSGDITNGSANMTLAKSGDGTQILTGANNYSGNTVITGGTLQVGDGGTTGSVSSATGQINIGSGAVLAINRSNSLAQGNSSALGNSASIIGNGSLLLMGGTGGTGSVTLNQANTYIGGTTLEAGTLKFGSNGSGSAGPLGNGGTFTINGGTIDTTTSRTVINVNPIVVGGNFSFGGTGDLTLPGTVDLGTATRTITTNGSAALTFTDAVSGGTGGALTKAGTGTLALNAANTYTGNTTITAGTLALTGSGSLSSSPVINVGTNGTLDVSAVSFAVGSGKALGGDGALTGAATFNNGSIFAWDLSVPTPSSNADISTGNTFAVSGNLIDGESDGGGSVFKILLGTGQNFSDNFWTADHSWSSVLTSGNSLALNTLFTSFDYANTAGSISAPTGGSFALSGTNLTWSAVPEPTSALAGLLIAAGLLRRRRA